jgi:hypothetical protein
MDRILQQENLDLKLTPYRVLATSSKHGFVQFVDSSAIADILTSEGSIQVSTIRCWLPIFYPQNFDIAGILCLS